MEFNLSEKRQVRNKQNSQIYNIPYTYSEEDVKEFIKLINKEIKHWKKLTIELKVVNKPLIEVWNRILSRFNKLAGDKLNGKKES